MGNMGLWGGVMTEIQRLQEEINNTWVEIGRTESINRKNQLYRHIKRMQRKINIERKKQSEGQHY